MIRTIQHYPHGACIVQGIHPYSGETGLYLMGYMPPHYPVPAVYLPSYRNVDDFMFWVWQGDMRAKRIRTGFNRWLQ